MPVHVDIPLRLRVDPDALRAGDLEDALAIATRRAFENSRKLVLEPRGATLGVRVEPPTFNWYGAGLTGVSPNGRAAFETRVGKLVADLASALSPATYQGPMSDAPAERIDRARALKLLSSYLVPSYEDVGTLASVPIESAQPSETPLEHAFVWRTVESPAHFNMWFEDELELRGITRPARGYLGAVYRHATEGMSLVVFSYPGEQVVGGRSLLVGPLTRFRLVGADGDARPERSVYELPPGATYRLRWFCRADELHKIRVWYRAYIEPIVRDLAKHHRISEAELEAAIERAVDDAVVSPRPETVCLVELTVDDAERFLIEFPFDLPQDLDAQLVPIVKLAPAPPGTPLVPGADGPAREELRCAPFEYEPSLDQLGKDGARLAERMSNLASMLGIDSCNYAGQFCLNAATAWRALVWGVTEYAITETAATTAVAHGGTGVLGLVDFAPVPSLAIDALCRLAEMVPRLSRLSWAVTRTYDTREHRAKLGGRFADDPKSWSMRFNRELSSHMTRAVAEHFAQTCRVLMLQLLRASRVAIESRMGNEAYADLFEDFVLYQLVNLDDLLRLREQLKTELPAEGITAALTEAAITTWREAARAYERAIEGRSPFAPIGPGELVRNEFGRVTAISDSQGRVWTLDVLDSVITMRRGVAESIDPVLEQLTDLPGEMERYRADPSTIRPRLVVLLNDMYKANDEITRKVQADSIYAFRIGSIRQDLEHHTVRGTYYPLEGIRWAAHQAVGKSFDGDDFYAEGINLLFGAELGREGIMNFLGFIGMALLAVTCPALVVFAAGTLLGSLEVIKAAEERRVYRALIDPDQIMRYAELEAQMFAAQLGLALSVVPGAMGILKPTSRVVGAGLRGGVRMAARQARWQFTRQMADQLKDGLAAAFVKELIEEKLEDVIFQQVLDPVLAELVRELSVAGPSGEVSESSGGQLRRAFE